jgi:hypothetical protein
MNTPIGLFGLSSLAREVCTRLAIICRPCFCPITRWSSVSASLSTDSISFFTIRPDRDAGPVLHHRADRLLVRGRQHQRRLACISLSFSVIALSSERSEARSSGFRAGRFLPFSFCSA